MSRRNLLALLAILLASAVIASTLPARTAAEANVQDVPSAPVDSAISLSSAYSVTPDGSN